MTLDQSLGYVFYVCMHVCMYMYIYIYIYLFPNPCCGFSSGSRPATKVNQASLPLGAFSGFPWLPPRFGYLDVILLLVFDVILLGLVVTGRFGCYVISTLEGITRGSTNHRAPNHPRRHGWHWRCGSSCLGLLEESGPR